MQGQSAKQLQLNLHEQLIVDLFAGGGGVSVGMEMAWGRSPDIAVNHNEHALSLHRRNHPQTKHFIADVYEVNPYEATGGKQVGWLHLSPDCTHHSQASAGQPRDAKIRGLSWVGYRWAAQVRPVCISLENVRPILRWGGLIAKRDKATGRVLKRFEVVTGAGKGKRTSIQWVPAEKGERVRVQDQYLIPDPKKEGKSWQAFTRKLEQLGYKTETRLIRAANKGGHTTRERLIMLARCDGKPIIWPEDTHSKDGGKHTKPWRPAYECIDFSHECPSIFKRKKSLASNTHKRITKGIEKFVLRNGSPFIVPIAHYNGTVTADSIENPLRTIKAATKGGELAIARPTLVRVAAAEGVTIPPKTGEVQQTVPILIQAGHGEGQPGGVQRWGVGAKDIRDSIGTVTASNGGQAIAVAYLMQANDGFNVTFGRALPEPITSITATGSQQQLVTAYLSEAETAEVNDPYVQGALQVFQMMLEHGEGERWAALRARKESLTVKQALAEVMVVIEGQQYIITDIGLRMLKPRELYNAQDFPPDYIIDEGHDGRRFTITQQVRMVGNSVDPLMLKDIFMSNAPALGIRKAA